MAIKMTKRHFMLTRKFLLILCSFGLLCPVNSAEEPAPDYLGKVKPLLRDKCFACHGANKQEGGLRLDAAGLIRQGGDSGSTIDTVTPLSSLLLERVTASDEERMPPPKDGSRLTDEEVALLKSWISHGAIAPDEPIPSPPSEHWSFQPPLQPKPPQVDADWIQSELDRFIAAEHQRAGLTAAVATSPEMLLRRVSLALTGLPPTPQELDSFLQNPDPASLEVNIERLLNSPRYGERWARHFMDIWRYSDPSGYGAEIRDGRQHIWRWRDWIIESLNADVGYDRMITEMLAADELNPTDPNTLRATGFLARNWYKFNRNVWLDNIVEHSSKAFLGLTLNCARCHDHKYDPFEQQAYYQMRAVFETHDLRDDPFAFSTDGKPTTDGMLVRSYDAHPDRQTFLFLQGNEDRPDEENPLSPGLPNLLGELSVTPMDLPPAAWYPALAAANRDAAVATATAQRTTAETTLQQAQTRQREADKALADFVAAPPSPLPGEQPEEADDDEPMVILADDFSQLNDAIWSVESGTWKSANGRLIQSTPTTEQHRLIAKSPHPRDFRAVLNLRITGGDQYKSVGLGFDGHGLAMNAVYLSAQGAKAQFTTQNASGTWSYPAAGTAPTTVNTGQDYQLELRVRDQLLNVLLDDELLLAMNLPERTAGHLSIWAFSATAEYDSLHVFALSETTQMQPPSAADAEPTRPKTKEDLQLAADIASAAVTAAEAGLQTASLALQDLQARTTAEMVRYQLADGDFEALRAAAVASSKQHAVRLLQSQIAQQQLAVLVGQQKRNNSAAAEKAKAVTEIEAAQKQLTDLQQKYQVAVEALDQQTGEYPTLGPQYPKTSSGRRLALARWITSRKNPLTARVLVNHVWMRHFGTPLVERTFDFGLRSDKPRHAQLLDWLAVQFMEDGWSLKRLHKRILTSGLYQRSSNFGDQSAANVEIDPDNQLLWRMNARRMEAEVVRDSVLALGGSLDTTTGGPPVDHTQGQTVLRRSIYFRQDKERQMTFLSLFDGAKVAECYERRSSVAPQQALALFNSQIASQQSAKIANLYGSQTGADYVSSLFRHILCRTPTAAEQMECTNYLQEFENSSAGRQQLALVLLNHNDFVSIR